MKSLVLKPYVTKIALLALLVGLTMCALPNIASAKTKWEAIAPEDLAATECKSYPGSSAEILFDRQVLDSSGDSQTQQFYRRIKIYSSKGATDEGVLSIEYPNEHKVWNLAARVTKPNGRTTDFTRKDFTESVVVKTDNWKVKRLTIAIPDLGSGDILDQIWTQSVDSEEFHYQSWFCQRTLPVREFVFSVESSTRNGSLLYFNVPDAKLTADGRDPLKLVMKNLPPFEEESFMPPERDVRGWFLILYTNPYMRWYDKKNDFWKELSSYWEEEFRLEIKPNGAIKAKAAELLQGMKSDEEKLKALYDFTQEYVTNFDYFKSAELEVAKKKLDDKDQEQSPGQTLAARTGYTNHVNKLFAALAKAAGYDVRLAWSASRNNTFNVRHQNGWLFLRDRVVVIRLGETSRYFAPGDYYVPAGMLHRANEDAPSLILDANKVIFEANSASTADKSLQQRQGRFTLDLEGNLEGEVEMTFSGHTGSSKKQDWAGKQEEEINTEFRAGITKRMSAAEVSELKWENLRGNKLPLIARYKIKVPAYADVAGSKVILTPNVFEHGAAAMFTSEKRKFAIYFPYAWSEHDDIEIALPEGYTLDAGSAPANIGNINATVGARYQVGFKAKSRKIVYKRDFALGADGAISFQVASYPILKKTFDAINRSDEHTLVLKQVETAPVPPTADAAVPASAPAAMEAVPAK